MGRQRIVVAALCAALMGGLGACAQLNASTSAPAPAQPEDVAACYRQSDLSGRWERMEGWTEEACFASDSCSGGLGLHAAGCLKWAIAADASPLPWPAQTEVAAERVVAPEDQIPLEHGLFVVRHPCDPGPCTTRWRAGARVPLYAEADQFSRRVGRLRVGEVVSAVEQIQYHPPRRGVMNAGDGSLAAGDVVYAVWGHCKGYDVWRRGEILYSDEDLVDWDPSPRLYNSRAGAWVRFERANGQAGWARTYVLGTHLTAINPPPPPEASAEDEEFDECE
ncbi:MAG: hypothetical protein NT015_06255 [Alphaproteobacteria bacterium]|nr:hypothetical protein [Alphaproteobacteria bacterium]